MMHVRTYVFMITTRLACVSRRRR